MDENDKGMVKDMISEVSNNSFQSGMKLQELFSDNIFNEYRLRLIKALRDETGEENAKGYISRISTKMNIYEHELH